MTVKDSTRMIQARELECQREAEMSGESVSIMKQKNSFTQRRKGAKKSTQGASGIQHLCAFAGDSLNENQAKDSSKPYSLL
jgi:hypothetical protein